MSTESGHWTRRRRGGAHLKCPQTHDRASRELDARGATESGRGGRGASGRGAGERRTDRCTHTRTLARARSFESALSFSLLGLDLTQDYVLHDGKEGGSISFLNTRAR